jgi:hypothetical protein
MTTRDLDERAFVIRMDVRGEILELDDENEFFEPSPFAQLFDTEDEATAEVVRLILDWATPDIRIYVHPVRLKDY